MSSRSPGGRSGAPGAGAGAGAGGPVAGPGGGVSGRPGGTGGKGLGIGVGPGNGGGADGGGRLASVLAIEVSCVRVAAVSRWIALSTSISRPIWSRVSFIVAVRKPSESEGRMLI
ncbi:hypothetical protein WG29040_23130 [Pseudomonas sp. PAMC 29040]|nr:hypothetical protein WG29040_23130 [Pseudomonas sp. PAMC 29040]